jgi:arginine decarboxylase
LIICNGYKDPAFIRLALLGRKLGKPVVIVAEKLEEVEQIIRASKEVGVEPWIGIRARLHSKGSGKWSPSGGENAKFGLDTTNLVAASQMLKDAGVAHCLKLVHFHVGSQVPDISTIKRAVREGARYYAKLSKLGHELGYLDVGSASTMMDRAATLTVRPIIRSRNTRTTSSGTSSTFATPKASRIRRL